METVTVWLLLLLSLIHSLSGWVICKLIRLIEKPVDPELQHQLKCRMDELNGIRSMMDEFSRFAKIQRQIQKLIKEKRQIDESRQADRHHARKGLTLVWIIIYFLCLWLLWNMGVHGRDLQLAPAWIYPLDVSYLDTMAVPICSFFFSSFFHQVVQLMGLNLNLSWMPLLFT